MPRLYSSLLLSVLIASSASATSTGSIVYFLEGAFGNDAPRGLYDYDLATSSSSFRTTVDDPPRYVQTVAVNPATGTAYTTWCPSFTDGCTVYTITIDDGAVSPAFQFSTQITQMDLDPVSGYLIATNNAKQVFTIDPVSGAVLNVVETVMLLTSFAFDSTNVLYSIDKKTGELFTLDPWTGTAVLIGGSGYAIGENVSGLSIPNDANFIGGRLIVGVLNGDIVEIDATTGARSLISNVGIGVRGMVDPSLIPEPSTGLLVIAGLLGLAGWRRARA